MPAALELPLNLTPGDTWGRQHTKGRSGEISLLPGASVLMRAYRGRARFTASCCFATRTWRTLQPSINPVQSYRFTYKPSRNPVDARQPDTPKMLQVRRFMQEAVRALSCSEVVECRACQQMLDETKFALCRWQVTSRCELSTRNTNLHERTLKQLSNCSGLHCLHTCSGL